MTDQNATAQPPARPVYARLAVIGCGLIGSSVIRAAREQRRGRRDRCRRRQPWSTRAR